MIIIPHIAVMAKTEAGMITTRNVVEDEVAVQVMIVCRKKKTLKYFDADLALLFSWSQTTAISLTL